MLQADNTALMLAAHAGHTGALNILLDNGASLELQDTVRSNCNVVNLKYS